MSQETNSANMENVHPAHSNDNPPSNRRWRNMAKRHQRSNSQDDNSSAASDSGTSTDWDGCWGIQECSACERWEVLKVFGSYVVARVSGVAETVDYFG